jgi:(p)ppGpp synthase/HD superfamily hydrolase
VRERARAMKSRVLDRVKREPLSLRDVEKLEWALTTALELRDGKYEDDHHVDLLHPARTALILLDDTGTSDPVLLSAGLLHESLDSATASAVAQSAFLAKHQDVAAVLERMASPLDSPMSDLLERLVVLPGPELTVVLAERLDHARHLHLRPSALWEDQLRIEEAVYLPLAARVGGQLGRRYGRWHSAMAATLRG